MRLWSNWLNRIQIKDYKNVNGGDDGMVMSEEIMLINGNSDYILGISTANAVYRLG